MSALILLSQVKKGTELAERYKLGQDIADIISQHHGTRLIRYFYQKALNQGEKPRESDFSYLGPRPQTKEAAILMLADSVEASSRTLSDPTPARIKTHIDTIIKGIFSEGQLDESELTFKDLHFLSENFLRILTGIFHQRIAYPDARIDAAKAEGKTNGKNGNGNGAGAAQAQGATALTLAAQGKTCGDKPCSDKTGADKVAAKNADADKPDSANPVEEQAAAIKALPGGPASAKPGAASAVILHPSGKGQA